MATSTMDFASQLAIVPTHQPANMQNKNKNHPIMADFFNFAAASGGTEQRQEERYCGESIGERWSIENLEDFDDLLAQWERQQLLPSTQEQDTAPGMESPAASLPMNNNPSMTSKSPNDQNELGATGTSSLDDSCELVPVTEQLMNFAQIMHNELQQGQQLNGAQQQDTQEGCEPILPYNGQYQEACQEFKQNPAQYMPAPGLYPQQQDLVLNTQAQFGVQQQPHQHFESNPAQHVPMPGQYPQQQDLSFNTQAQFGDMPNPQMTMPANVLEHESPRMFFPVAFMRALGRELGCGPDKDDLDWELPAYWQLPDNYEAQSQIAWDHLSNPATRHNIVAQIAHDMRSISAGRNPKVERREAYPRGPDGRPRRRQPR